MSSPYDGRIAKRGIATLFPDEVVTVEAEAAAWDAPLHPEEEAFVASAVPVRRREFAAGRACARRALERLGIRDFPLLVNEDRSPVWPEGVVGSISHCAGYCAAAVARRAAVASLGLDAEEASPLEEKLHATVLTPRERGRLAELPRRDGLDWPKLVFSAKESVYKCWHPVSKSLLDFLDVEVDFDPELDAGAGRFAARIAGGPELSGRFAREGALVLCGVTLPK